MTTVIQGESSGGDSGLTGIALIIILVVGIALGIAYMNGAFTGPITSTTVVEHKTVEHKTVVVPVEVPVIVEKPAE